MTDLAGQPEAMPEPTLVTIGDIVVSQNWVVTPGGTKPRQQVVWSVTPMVQTTESIPPWAIVCCVIFFIFCLLGLLFLLAKEQKTTGSVQVSVQGPDFHYVTYVPIYDLHQVQDIVARVDYVRSLSNAS
jgi:hypothetical protein